MPEKKTSKVEMAKDAVRGVYDAHKDAVTVKNAGILLGKAASLIAKPCVQLYDGVREGFNQKAPPERE